VVLSIYRTQYYKQCGSEGYEVNFVSYDYSFINHNRRINCTTDILHNRLSTATAVYAQSPSQTTKQQSQPPEKQPQQLETQRLDKPSQGNNDAEVDL
jgi:hypothetical protein